MKCFNDNFKTNQFDSCPSSNAYRVHDICFYIVKAGLEDLSKYRDICSKKNFTLFDDSPQNNAEIIDFVQTILNYYKLKLKISNNLSISTYVENFFDYSTGQNKYLSLNKIPITYWNFAYILPNSQNLQLNLRKIYKLLNQLPKYVNKEYQESNNYDEYNIFETDYDGIKITKKKKKNI